MGGNKCKTVELGDQLVPPPLNAQPTVYTNACTWNECVNFKIGLLISFNWSYNWNLFDDDTKWNFYVELFLKSNTSRNYAIWLRLKKKAEKNCKSFYGSQF